MPSSKNSLQILKKKPPAKKQWKAVPSKPSAITPINKRSISPIKRPKFKKAPVDKVLKLLRKHYPDAHCELVHKNPFELVVATALSAQCTDVMVNKATPGLFKKFPTPQALANADLAEVEACLASLNLFRNKSKNIKSMAQSLVEKHNGEVPRTVEELTELAGVGRKTANVVLGNAFQIASGVVVDTHVARLSDRFNWTDSEKPLIIEKDLQKIIPEDRWILISHELIFHGRRVCFARNPQCDKCFLFDVCPRRGVEFVEPKKKA